jgi:hypothetical protein
MQVVCQVFTKWLSSPPDPLFKKKATIHLVAFFIYCLKNIAIYAKIPYILKVLL